MIWETWFVLVRGWRKRRFFQRSIQKAETEIYNQEFKKHQLNEIRGGMREQYQYILERIEGAKRKILELKYSFFQENGDPIESSNLPLSPEEAETLPDTLVPPNRFYKQDKKHEDKANIDKQLEELQRIVDRREPDAQNVKENIEKIDGNIAGIEQ